MLKLNLGCGKATFPLNREKPAFADHLSPFLEMQFEPGWINVDKYGSQGVDEVIDLFEFPWIRSTTGKTFEDNSVDVIFASHILEHIPHAVHVSRDCPINHYRRMVDQVANLDGWFVFFGECWRIMKPSALIYCYTPWALSTPGMCDPTHTRYILPGTYSYLVDHNDEAPFDYHVPHNFELVGMPSMRMRAHFTRADGGEPTAEETLRLALMNFDSCDELRITLRAVKDEP